MKDNTINYTVKGSHYALKVISEDKYDIDIILDQLNICSSNITDVAHEFLNPISIEVYDESNTRLIAVLKHEKDIVDPGYKSTTDKLIGSLKKDFFKNN